MADKFDNRKTMELLKRPLKDLKRVDARNGKVFERSVAEVFALLKKKEMLVKKAKILLNDSEFKEKREKINDMIQESENSMKMILQDLDSINLFIDKIIERNQGNSKKMEVSEKEYEEKLADIDTYGDEMKKKLAEAKIRTKNAEAELNLRKESLSATKQVLESKMACLDSDRQETLKRQKILDLMRKADNREKLELYQQRKEKLFKIKNDLRAKLEEKKTYLSDLELKNKMLTAKVEDMPQRLEIQRKNNEKLRQDLSDQKKEIFKEITDTALIEMRIKKREIFDLAKTMKDCEAKKKELSDEIENLKIKSAESTEKSEEINATISDKKQMLTKIEEDIVTANAENEKNQSKANDLCDSRNKAKSELDKLKENIEAKKIILKELQDKKKKLKNSKMNSKSKSHRKKTIYLPSSSSEDSFMNLTLSSDLPGEFFLNIFN